MKLIPCDVNEFRRGYERSNNYEILREFNESGLDCAKVENYTQINATSCATSLRTSIKRYRFGNLECKVRRGEVFLIQKEK